MQHVEALAARADHAHQRQRAQTLRIDAQPFDGYLHAPQPADSIPPLLLQLAFSDRAERVLVIAEHGMEPGLVEQRQRLFRLRAAIDEIADREQPVARRIEIDLAQQEAQRVDATVQIADDEIASGPVDGMMLDDGDKCGIHNTMIVRACKRRMRGISRSHAFREPDSCAVHARLRAIRIRAANMQAPVATLMVRSRFVHCGTARRLPTCSALSVGRGLPNCFVT